MDKISEEMEAAESEAREAIVFCMIFMTLFIVSISSYWIFQHKSDIHFYEDYIDCLDNERSAFQNVYFSILLMAWHLCRNPLFCKYFYNRVKKYFNFFVFILGIYVNFKNESDLYTFLFHKTL